MESNPLLAPPGLPDFTAIQPEHIAPAVDETLARNRADLAALLAAVTPGAEAFDRIVPRIEALAERLHRVWAPVNHLHSVLNTPPLREAYNAALPAVSRYATELGHNRRLFELYERLVARTPRDDSGAARLLELAVRDFRLAGVHLDDSRKARFQTIMEEMARAEAAFEQHLIDSAAAWSMHITDERRIGGLPSMVLEAAAQKARAKNQDGWLFDLTQPVFQAITTYADDSDLRYRVYRGWVTRASDKDRYAPQTDNSEVMEHILKLRHEAAGLVGFDTYADYALATRMARSVDEVRAFLDQLTQHALPAARRELEELEAFAGHALDPWDLAYYAEKLRHHRHAISDEALRPYFPLEHVLGGLFDIVGRLYGVRFVRDDLPAWERHVRHYRVVDREGTAVGGCYMDFFARQNKRSGAWMDQALNRMRDDNTLQRPVAHLVCNYALPVGDTPCLLTHDDVVTLFHEMGHVLHHLLTRIDYPSIAGINGVPWDAVELPSQFMESFAWEPAVLAMVSSHWQTGEPLPADMVRRLRESRNFHSALHMMRQVEYALFDLRLHAGYDPARGGRVGEILKEVRDAVSVVIYQDWNRFAHSFSHIFAGGYAAGYYSYKWAEVLAADAFAAFEEGGLFDTALAERFLGEILAIGGSRDIGEAYVAFRGRPAQVDALLRQAGIGVSPDDVAPGMAPEGVMPARVGAAGGR